MITHGGGAISRNEASTASVSPSGSIQIGCALGACLFLAASSRAAACLSTAATVSAASLPVETSLAWKGLGSLSVARLSEGRSVKRAGPWSLEPAARCDATHPRDTGNARLDRKSVV